MSPHFSKALVDVSTSMRARGGGLELKEELGPGRKGLPRISAAVGNPADLR
jgi:hypothetical protein